MDTYNSMDKKRENKEKLILTLNSWFLDDLDYLEKFCMLKSS